MNPIISTIPMIELPEFATANGRFLASVAYARECVSYRVGYEVELASIVPVSREDGTNMLVAWRPKRRLEVVAGRIAA